ncbi:MBL fold metallo-hydrolase [Agilicoccus flavus]|uniref:MBL fold metallo-hydrolase n=1 Tax=Agilicoccus flavus TaxID=2775968 RepID=UPI001CF64128|nr:MBL fold metallo-hydrolase [Agilicoccus flavus]
MSERIDTPDVIIRRISVSDMDNNVYLLTARATGVRVLIDAADDPEAIAALLQESLHESASDAGGGGEADGAPALHAICTTHSHWDHVRALPQVAATTGATTMAGADDAGDIEHPTRRPLHHGDVVEVGRVCLEAIHLRGHTPGSIAFLLRTPDGPDHLFSGDSLFPGGVGKTNSPADFRSLLDDVEERLFDALPDDTVVHPGHGAATTIGAERPHLAEWRERGW